MNAAPSKGGCICAIPRTAALSSGLQGPATGDSSEAFTSTIGDNFEGSDPSAVSNQQALGALVETDDFSFGSGNEQESIAPWMERVRKDLLISASEETGGRAYFANTSVAVEEVSGTLDHYYSLAYAADHSGDGERHVIEVTTTMTSKTAVGGSCVSETWADIRL